MMLATDMKAPAHRPVSAIRSTMLAGLDDLLLARRLPTTVDQLLDQLGSKTKPPQDLALDTYLLLLERIAELTRDPCFGLTFARALPLGYLKLFSFLMANAPDLRTMVRCVSRYVRLQLDVLQIKFSERGASGRSPCIFPIS